MSSIKQINIHTEVCWSLYLPPWDATIPSKAAFDLEIIQWCSRELQPLGGIQYNQTVFYNKRQHVPTIVYCIIKSYSQLELIL